jgi:hypothetical protein
MAETILLIIFFLGMASVYIGVPNFPARDIFIGICALVIAIVKIVQLLRSS